MAKILCNYFGLSMAAEGKSEFVGRQAAAFFGLCAAGRGALRRKPRMCRGFERRAGEDQAGILRNDEELRERVEQSIRKKFPPSCTGSAA